MFVTDAQLLLGMGVPILVALIGLVWTNRSNNAAVTLLRAEMNGKFDVMNVQLAGISARLDAITRTQELMQQDLKRFFEIANSLDKRVSTLESKQERL